MESSAFDAVQVVEADAYCIAGVVFNGVPDLLLVEVEGFEGPTVVDRLRGVALPLGRVVGLGPLVPAEVAGDPSLRRLLTSRLADAAFGSGVTAIWLSRTEDLRVRVEEAIERDR